MALFLWNDEFSVKVGTFDGHHKRLIDLINQLHDAMSSGKGREVIGKIVNSLIEYTKYHFGEEERLMTKYVYDGLPVHKIEHQKFVDKVSDLKAKLDKGDMSVTMETMRFLKEWLSKHILETDKKYSGFFNENGVV